MKIRTRLSNKAIFHWIFIIIVSGLLFNSQNRSVTYLIISFIVLTLIFNRITYLKLKADSLVITKNNIFFVPTDKFFINLNDITKLSLIDSRDIQLNNSGKYLEFEAVVVVEVLTGTLFYKPDFILIIDFIDNKRVESELNSDRGSMLKMFTLLQKEIHELKNQSYGI